MNVSEINGLVILVKPVGPVGYGWFGFFYGPQVVGLVLTCWLPMITNTTSGNLRAPIIRLCFLSMYLVYVLQYVPQLSCNLPQRAS